MSEAIEDIAPAIDDIVRCDGGHRPGDRWDRRRRSRTSPRRSMGSSDAIGDIARAIDDIEKPIDNIAGAISTSTDRSR